MRRSGGQSSILGCQAPGESDCIFQHLNPSPCSLRRPQAERHPALLSSPSGLCPGGRKAIGLRESLAAPSQARSAVVPLAIDSISDNRKSKVPHGADAFGGRDRGVTM
jgi:hypothetical protein